MKRNHYNSCPDSWLGSDTLLSELTIGNDKHVDFLSSAWVGFQSSRLRGARKGSFFIQVPSLFRDETYFVSPIYENVNLLMMQKETAIVKVARTLRLFCSRDLQVISYR